MKGLTMDREGSVRRTSQWLVGFAIVVTVFAIGGAVWVAWAKDIGTLALNEIGDSVAGLTGFIAFVWLITAVILQYMELGLQRNEIRNMRRATEEQAKQLGAATKIDALNLLIARMEAFDPRVNESSKQIRELLQQLAEQASAYTELIEYEPYKHPKEAVAVALLCFWEEAPAETEKIKFRENLKYRCCILYSDLVDALRDLKMLVNPLESFAETHGIQKHFHAWSRSYSLLALMEFFPKLERVQRAIRERVAEGGVGSDFQTAVHQVVLKLDDRSKDPGWHDFMESLNVAGSEEDRAVDKKGEEPQDSDPRS